MLPGKNTLKVKINGSPQLIVSKPMGWTPFLLQNVSAHLVHLQSRSCIAAAGPRHHNSALIPGSYVHCEPALQILGCDFLVGKGVRRFQVCQ